MVVVAMIRGNIHCNGRTNVCHLGDLLGLHVVFGEKLQAWTSDRGIIDVKTIAYRSSAVHRLHEGLATLPGGRARLAKMLPVLLQRMN